VFLVLLNNVLAVAFFDIGVFIVLNMAPDLLLCDRFALCEIYFQFR